MITLANIPSANIKPEGARKSVVRSELVRNSFGRRAFLKTIIVVSGSALLVGIEGGIRKIGAFADTAPTYGSCAEYVQAQKDNYGVAYANGAGRWWAVCNPHATDIGGGDIGWGQIGNQFCNADGYHRTDVVPQSATLVYNYNRRPASCAGKNAWAWKVDLNADTKKWQNKHSRRCSDGQRITLHDGTEVSRINTACKQMLPGFDPPVGQLQYDVWTPDGCDPGVATPAGC